jgi:hypothetical protein
MSRIAKLQHEALTKKMYQEHANHPTFSKPNKYIPPRIIPSGRVDMIPKRKRNANLIPVEKEVFSDEPKQKKLKRAPLEVRLRPEYDEENEEPPKPEAWEPKEILDHLKNKGIVTNVGRVVASIKGKGQDGAEDKIIVWDHGESALGKKSDTNLFRWLVAYAAHECVRKRSKDDEVFEDGASSKSDLQP